MAMGQGTKLALDLVFGAVIPIAVLNFLTAPLGAPLAYIVAALVPVGWIAVDLLFITRAFNFITSYIGLSAIVSGALAFWFVDGLLFALKDSASFAVAVAVFAGSLLAGRPLLQYFFAQVVRPDTPAKHAKLHTFLGEPPLRRAMIAGTAIVVAVNLILGAINFWLNRSIVVAPFGVEAFNQQVAQVNAITRLLFPVPSIAGFALAFYLVFRAAYRLLPVAPGTKAWDADFWALMDKRASDAGSAPPESA